MRPSQNHFGRVSAERAAGSPFARSLGKRGGGATALRRSARPPLLVLAPTLPFVASRREGAAERTER